MYVSDRDIVVADKKGVSARFEAGVPRPLRESLVALALAAGAREVEAPKPVRQPRKQKVDAQTEAE